MSPFFEIKFQLSCHVSFNPAPPVIDEPRFFFVDCESGEYHFTGAGGYSLVYNIAQVDSEVYMSAFSPSLGESTGQPKQVESWQVMTQIMILVFDVFDVWTFPKFQDMSRKVQ